MRKKTVIRCDNMLCVKQIAGECFNSPKWKMRSGCLAKDAQRRIIDAIDDGTFTDIKQVKVMLVGEGFGDPNEGKRYMNGTR